MSALAIALFSLSSIAQETGDVTTRPVQPRPLERADRMDTVKVVLEDGVTAPQGLVVEASENCRIDRVVGTGLVIFTRRQPTHRSADSQTPVAGDYAAGEKETSTVISAQLNQRFSESGGPCFARVMAPGTRSALGLLRDGQTIVLKRLAEGEGSTISTTVLQAPPGAKKAYARGEESLLKRNYGEAAKHFRKALELYPDYAMAWSELGAALTAGGQPGAARGAFEKAIAIDPKYLKPLVQLARLEAEQQHWTECARASDAAIALHPVEFPGAYYYRALAHLNRGEWKSVVDRGRECVEVDVRREFPRAHLLIAMALEQTGDRARAAEALVLFLKQSPPAREAQLANEHLSRLLAAR